MSVYRVTEIIGTSSTSWEDAAAEAIRTAAGTLHDLRVAEVVKQDIHLDEGGEITYRTKLQLSFKYESRALTLIRSPLTGSCDRSVPGVGVSCTGIIP